jgi:predicted MFS family arabinose efflux permease
MVDLITMRVSLAPIYWLALGTFAVGTESFMIAGRMPDMLADPHATCRVRRKVKTVPG